MKPYPAYKSSNIEWLGDIPEHWETIKAKWIFKKEKREVRDIDEVVTAFRDGIVTLRQNRRLQGYTESIQEIGYQGVRKFDLVIHQMDGFAGAIGISDSDGKCTPIYSICTPKIVCEVFFYARLIREMARSGYIQALAKGIRERSTDFRYQDFSILELPCPPLEEQQAIAQYLDQKAAQIEGFIANKTRLIELLKEEKTAYISELMQEAAQRYKSKKLKYVAKINPSKTYSRIKEKEGQMVVFLPMENVSETGEISNELRKPIEEVRNGYTFFSKNDIVLAKITPCFENGKSAWLNSLETEFGFGTTELHVFRVSSKLSAPFLFYIFKTEKFMNVGEAFMVGSAGQKRVPTNFISNYEIPLPPLAEQEAIVAKIQTKHGQIDAVITRIQKEIDLMKEYKTALISEAVTGKICVL